jgi:nicotinamidase-related amidase
MSAKTSGARSILEILNATPAPPRLAESAVIVVDAQREYVDGTLPLSGVGEALQELKKLLDRARRLGVPVFHIVHHAPDGAPVFNPQSHFVEIAEPARPAGQEPVIIKHLPSSFVNTNLQELIDQTKRKNLIVAGFMTHMCIDATTRSATDLGYAPTVIANACATRDLQSRTGAIIPASTLHESSLAALGDLVAGIVDDQSKLPD